MNFFKILISACVVFVTLSCSTKKDIFLLQNADLDTDYQYDFDELKIGVDDILKITINSKQPETIVEFTPQGSAVQASTKENYMLNGFQVDLNGYISFPSIGKIFVSGLTVNNLRDKLSILLKEKSILIDPSIDVKILNLQFTIIGEVNNPGRYDFLENNISIFEAIGMAGDLTINGKRKNIKIIREYDSSRKIFSVDISKPDILISDNFQIFPGDIIIVNPNTSRIKNAGIIGNSGTLLSLLSFILSSIIIITNS